MVCLRLVRLAPVWALAFRSAFAQEVIYAEFHQDFSRGFETPYRANLTEDERIAGLSTLWAEAKHNFVFFDRLRNFNWDARYLEYLPKVRAARTTLEYYRLLQRLCTELREGHSVVRLPDALTASTESVPAIQLGRIRGKVMITSVDDPALAEDRVWAGLEITTVDGIPVEQYASERIAPYYGDDHRSLHYLLGGGRDVPVALGLRDGNGPDFTRQIPRVRFAVEATAQMESPRFRFKLLHGKIGYLALNTFREAAIVDEFYATFDLIRKTDALIIDLRNNHGGNALFSDRILACFTREPIASEFVESPLVMSSLGKGGGAPLRQSWTRTIQPDGSRLYEKPVALLMGAHTASAAESFVVGFDSLRRGKTMGQRTAGTTGRPAVFSLPGGGTGSVCAMRVRYASGKEFMFTGINPDVEIQTTTTDLRAAIDTVLEAALRDLLHQISAVR